MRTLLAYFAIPACFLSTLLFADDRATTLAKSADNVPTNACQKNVSNEKTCHSLYTDGCTLPAASDYDPYLSFLKNTTPTPEESVPPVKVFTSLKDFQNLDQQTRELGLGREPQQKFANDLARMGQGNFYGVIGYLYYAVKGGVEACNCYLQDEADRDFHLGIGFDSEMAAQFAKGQLKPSTSSSEPSSPAQQASIVVEMTPHYRDRYHPTWHLPAMQTIVGMQVKVIGQLLLDTEHNQPSQNCAFSNTDPKTCWRGSTWEIHPITKFFVCTNTAPCTVDSDDGWTELDTLLSAPVNGHPTATDSSAPKSDGAGNVGEVFQVGGSISPPKNTYQTSPDFPEKDRKAGHQGTVVIRAVVGTDGKIHNPRVVRSLGWGLDEKALEAVSHWVFDPATKDGRKVAVYVDVEVNFRLY